MVHPHPGREPDAPVPPSSPLALIAVNLFVYFAVQLPRSRIRATASGAQRGRRVHTTSTRAIPCELTDGHPLDVAQFVTQTVSPQLSRSDRRRRTGGLPRQERLARGAASRCSCTARSCTCSATCCSSGSSATTSRIGSARSVPRLLPRRRCSPRPRRTSSFNPGSTVPIDRRVGRDRRRDGRVHRVVAARADPQPDPDRCSSSGSSSCRPRSCSASGSSCSSSPTRTKASRGSRTSAASSPAPRSRTRCASATAGPLGPPAAASDAGRPAVSSDDDDWDRGFGGGYRGRLRDALRVRVRGDELRREPREVVGDERRRRIGHRLLAAARRRRPTARARTASRARRERAVGRRTIADHDAARRRTGSRTSATVAASGLPATSGCAPDAVATAATSAPAPGTRPPATGYVGVEVGRDEARAGRAPRRRARVSRSKSNSRCQPTTTASAGAAIDDVEARRARAPRRRPGPRTASTRAPGASDRAPAARRPPARSIATSSERRRSRTPCSFAT